MSALWTAAEAAAATGGRTTCDWTATGVSIDTRSIAPGELFVALKDVRDGHDFVAGAVELGAVAAQAQANLDTASGDYQIADAVLSFSSPAIAGLTPKVDSALQEVSDAIAGLVGPGGDLVDEVNGLLVDLDPALNLLGGSGNVTATVRDFTYGVWL